MNSESMISVLDLEGETDSDSLRSMTYSDFDGEDTESSVQIEWMDDSTCLTFSCPDRTGLGFRLARIVFDFGLSVKQADFYTDGQWCYVKLIVKAQSSEPDENLLNTLRRRLEAECPPNQRRVTQYYENPIPFKPPGRYQLQIRMKDKIGIFHGLCQTLRNCELVVHSASVNTSPSGEAIDLFWITDNRNQLPDADRMEEITDTIRHQLNDHEAVCNFKEAGTFKANNVPESRSQNENHGIENGLRNFAFDEDEDDHRLRQIGIDTTVEADHITSSEHTLLIVKTRDRKGLLYDCLRTIKACELRVTNGTLEVKLRDDGKEYCHIELFVQDKNNRPLGVRGQPPLQVSRGRHAGSSNESEVALDRVMKQLRWELNNPFRVFLKKITKTPGESCTELTVASALESNGYGRPRVVIDVTDGIQQLGLQISKATIYTEKVRGRLEEVQRFSLTDQNGQAINESNDCQRICNKVFESLLGPCFC